MKISKRTCYTIVLLAIVAITTGICVRHNIQQQEKLKVEVMPFKTGNGWGYNVVVDKKIFIHQETIPAFAENQSFISKDDAIKTGNLVVKKMVAGNLFPALSLEEVMGLGIRPMLSAQ